MWETGEEGGGENIDKLKVREKRGREGEIGKGWKKAEVGEKADTK